MIALAQEHAEIVPGGPSRRLGRGSDILPGPGFLGGDAPYTGSWLPEQPGGLAIVNGEQAQGAWTLRVIDDSSSEGFGATLVDWSIDALQVFIESTGAEVQLRFDTDGNVVRSDNGNVFLDARYPAGIDDAAALEERLLYRAGIVDTGLFLGMAEAAVIASPEGVFTLTPDSTIPAAS